jgi:tetratricopeptide (TPR) repeat protein
MVICQQTATASYSDHHGDPVDDCPPLRYHTRVRPLLALLLSILLLAGAAVQAQGLDRQRALRALSSADAQMRRDAVSRLGEVGSMPDTKLLVKALRDPDEDVRDLAQQSMWSIWARSGDKQVDRLYQLGVQQMTAGDLEQSIATFTRIIELKPDFAEGWNKRATLYFIVGDLRKSLADCDQVMKRNPYHFGALAGYAQIYFRLENYNRALEYSRRALEVNPNMDAVRSNLRVIEHLIEQRRKQMI